MLQNPKTEVNFNVMLTCPEGTCTEVPKVLCASRSYNFVNLNHPRNVMIPSCSWMSAISKKYWTIFLAQKLRTWSFWEQEQTHSKQLIPATMGTKTAVFHDFVHIVAGFSCFICDWVCSRNDYWHSFWARKMVQYFLEIADIKEHHSAKHFIRRIKFTDL